MAKKTIVHPIIGEMTLEANHADRVLAKAKSSPNGWKLKHGESGTSKKVKGKSEQAKADNSNGSGAKDAPTHRESEPAKPKD